MQDISFAGIIVAVIAVFSAYLMGYANGVAKGRDEGFDTGKKHGTREDTYQAYAAGFDRGKRARDEDDEEDDDDDESDSSESGSNFGLAILAVAAGLLGVIWISSQTSTTPIQRSNRPTQPHTPLVEATDSHAPTRSEHKAAPRQYSPLGETVTLPRVNRALPSASHLPPNPTVAPNHKDASNPYHAPATIDRDIVEFPHPPPRFGEPR